MSTVVRGMAGRLAIAILLVLLAAGSAVAAVATLPGLATAEPAEETAAPSDPASTEPSSGPAEDASAEPTASPDAAGSPDAIAPAAPVLPGPATPGARDADEDEDADDERAPSLANLERIVARLGAAGITTTTEALAALAAEVGVGGAVRVLLFADAAGTTPAAILARFASGEGWGVIAKELGVHPGLGSVMGHGQGHDPAAKAAEKAARARERAERKAIAGE
jgi:hypothetical protein